MRPPSLRAKFLDFAFTWGEKSGRTCLTDYFLLYRTGLLYSRSHSSGVALPAGVRAARLHLCATRALATVLVRPSGRRGLGRRAARKRLCRGAPFPRLGLRRFCREVKDHAAWVAALAQRGLPAPDLGLGVLVPHRLDLGERAELEQPELLDGGLQVGWRWGWTFAPASQTRWCGPLASPLR